MSTQEDYTSLARPDPPFSHPEIIPHFEGKVPRHIGIIMDGNGRWAQQRGLARTEGHKAAEPVVLDTIAGAIEAGVRYLTLYTFSTENWNRSPAEVRFLMSFSRDVIRRRVPQMNDWGVRVRWAGRRPRLWASVINELERAEEITKNNKVIDVVFAINYGGQAEIVDAVNDILSKGEKKVTKKSFASHLYNSDIPDLDLIVRSSGEKRLSNFMLWQSAYAELDFEPELWPECGRKVLWRAINAYCGRKRRFGSIEAT